MIKKTIGTEPKVVTDPKGNTWYEFNIPKKFREGKAEIKALSTVPIGIGASQLKNEETPKQKQGGVVKDNLGYWNPDNWGHPVEIDSPNITMENVNVPLLGVSDEGDTKLLKPGKNYKFKGKKVTEYPIARYGINELNELTNFTNTKSGKWLNKYS